MYTWNNIRINILGIKNKFTADICEHLPLSLLDPEEKITDIEIFIYDSAENMLPPLKKDSSLKKTIVFKLEEESRLDIYSSGEEMWYLYHEKADYWMDLKNNRIIISLYNKSFNFQYYNILFFLIYPLGMLLENFNYYRIHSSCIDIDGSSVLITGLSGSGKSTAALALALNGGNIISDDFTFIKRTKKQQYSPHSLTKMVKLHDATVKTFFSGLLNYNYIKSEEGELYFNGNEINRRPVDRSIIDSIIILEKTENIRSNFTVVHPSMVIPHIFPGSIQIDYEKLTTDKFIFLIDMLNHIPCYKVYFGTDMNDFYKNIIGVLNNNRTDL